MSKVPVEQRSRLFHSIKKGSNKAGGVFGGASPDREPSPNKVVSIAKGEKDTNNQRYQHSQRDPIIVRGGQNVAVNHLVIRKHDFK
jgi:hypothetical protein